jgi:hypothetical protein
MSNADLALMVVKIYINRKNLHYAKKTFYLIGATHIDRNQLRSR